MSKPVLLFDVDGVIIDSYEILYESISAFVKQYGKREMSEEDFRKAFEGNALQTIMEMANISILDLALHPGMIKEYFGQYQSSKPFAGITEVLQNLSEQYELVVITSTLIEMVEPVFKDNGLYELFDLYLGPKSGIHKQGKILKALEKFDSLPENAYFISDTSGDILEAKEVGVKTIGVTWGYHSEVTIRSADPDMVVSHPEDLMKIFK